MKSIVIAGAIYRDHKDLVRPVYSGQYYAVNCWEYKTEEDIRQEYPHEEFEKFTGHLRETIVYGGVVFYRCECHGHYTEDFELLSSLEDINFFDHTKAFKKLTQQ